MFTFFQVTGMARRIPEETLNPLLVRAWMRGEFNPDVHAPLRSGRCMDLPRKYKLIQSATAVPEEQDLGVVVDGVDVALDSEPLKEDDLGNFFAVRVMGPRPDEHEMVVGRFKHIVYDQNQRKKSAVVEVGGETSMDGYKFMRKIFVPLYRPTPGLITALPEIILPLIDE